MRPAYRLLLALLLFAVCMGCQNKQEAIRNDLKAVGLAYITYQEEKKESPSNWDELIAFAEQEALAADAIKRVRDAGYQVTWDLDRAESTGSTVLAKSSSGGPVLMANGRVPEDAEAE